MPRYEFKEGTSSKFWEITLEGDSFTTRYGKIGTDGQTSTKEFDSEARAKKEYDKIIAEKVKKGYALVAGEDDGGDEEKGNGAGGGHTKSNPQLEAAILADPDDANAYLVYGDWLQAQGDPRGELVIVQHTLLAKPEFRKWQELSKTEAKLLEQHQEHLLGAGLSDHKDLLKLTWHLGFVKSARIALDHGSGEGAAMEEMIEALLDHPSGRFLQELVVGIASHDGENEYQAVVDLLVKKKPETLRSLYLGDFEFPDETEMSWSHLGDCSKLYAAFPKLRSLTLQSGDMTLGKIVLPDLKEFTVKTGGLNLASIKSICAATWPKLERLEVWFGSDNYGAEGGVEEIQPILEASGLSKLKHLALKNAEFTDDMCVALAKSKVLPQLETLDLSMGCMTATGAGAIAAKKDAFTHLKLLNVEDNAIAEGQADILQGICKEVRIGEQREDKVDGEDRYPTVGE